MTTTRLFYPAGIRIGTEIIRQMNDQSVDANLEDLTEYAAGDFVPSFTGSRSLAPEFQQTTIDVHRVLELCDPNDGGAEWLSRSVAAGNADMWFRQGQSNAWRYSETETQHVVYRMIQNAMMYWSTLQAQQDQEATIQYTVCASLTPTNPLLTLLNNTAIQEAPRVEHVWTLGPILVNGAPIDGLQSMQWSNNIEVDKVAGSGEEGPSFLCGRQARPVVSFDGHDLEGGQSTGTQGLALSGDGLRVYLRRRAVSGINYQDSDAVHVLLHATGGTVKWRRTTGDRGMGTWEVHLHRPAAGAALFDVDVGVTLP